MYTSEKEEKKATLASTLVQKCVSHNNSRSDRVLYPNNIMQGIAACWWKELWAFYETKLKQFITNINQFLSLSMTHGWNFSLVSVPWNNVFLWTAFALFNFMDAIHHLLNHVSHFRYGLICGLVPNSQYKSSKCVGDPSGGHTKLTLDPHWFCLHFSCVVFIPYSLVFIISLSVVV